MADNLTQSGEPTTEQILAEVSGQGSSQEQTPEATTTQNTTPQQTEAEMFEYSAAGRVVKEPKDMVLKRASMGYDYAQKMEAFKREQEAFAAKQAELQSAEGVWKPVLDYAKQNPEWEKFVREQWEKRDSFSQGKYDTLEPVMAEKLTKIDGFIKEYENERQIKRKEAEDMTLMNSIQAVQKEFPDIDLKQADDQGRTLEYRVLEHANRNGINSFRAAFRDLMFEDVLARKEAAAKEAVAKELATRTKSGLLGTTQAPIMGKGSVDTKSKSWNELTDLAMKELGIN